MTSSKTQRKREDLLAEGSFTAFRTFVSQYGLWDLKHSGNHLSWRGTRYTHYVRSRLDRSMVNCSWNELFPLERCRYLRFEGSDHRPLVTYFNKSGPQRKGMFRFNRSLTDKKEVEEVVESEWNGSPLASVISKLNSCRRGIIQWAREQNLKNNHIILQNQEALEETLSAATPNQELIDQLTSSLITAYKEEESFWLQRSRIQWLKSGDRNTCFFHAATRQRRLINSLYVIEDDEGRIVYEEEQICTVNSEYFNNIFKTNSNTDFGNLSGVLSCKVSEETIRQLTLIPSDSEIKEAAFSINNTLAWLLDKSGVYTTKTGYGAGLNIDDRAPPEVGFNWTKSIWNVKTAPKLKDFLWKVVRRAIPVSANLENMGILPFGCKTCNAREDDLHVFLNCEVAKLVWDLAPLSTRPSSLTPSIASLISNAPILTNLPPVGLTRSGNCGTRAIFSGDNTYPLSSPRSDSHSHMAEALAIRSAVMYAASSNVKVLMILSDSLSLANAASGMAVEDECKLKFLELKSKRNYRFIIFRIDGQQVVVEKLGSPEENYDDFSNSLPANECRYAVFDFDFTTAENCQKSKIFFIAWSPDSSRVRMKMVYASSKDRFKRELDGIQVELQATDPSEMSFDIIKSRAL
ncbi:hypothetical protein YC2023_122284 [Brassica napus]